MIITHARPCQSERAHNCEAYGARLLIPAAPAKAKKGAIVKAGNCRGALNNIYHTLFVNPFNRHPQRHVPEIWDDTDARSTSSFREQNLRFRSSPSKAALTRAKPAHWIRVSVPALCPTILKHGSMMRSYVENDDAAFCHQGGTWAFRPARRRRVEFYWPSARTRQDHRGAARRHRLKTPVHGTLPGPRS